MAETKNSLAIYLAALVGGLCIGTIGMSALIAPQLLWSNSQGESGYALREDLEQLEPSTRVQASVVSSARDVDVRPSDPLETVHAPYPVRLVIASIGVDAKIEAVGLEPDTSGADSTNAGESTVAVPGRTEAGWYKFGSTPGEAGATVLAGHVDLGGAEGVFWDLTELEGGSAIEVHLSDGSVANYRTIRGTDFSRDTLPSAELFRQSGAPALHLITCGGEFNRNLGRYESNYVVTAAPVYENA